MKETMTIHKALSELKVIGDRIEKELNNITYVTTNKASASKYNGADVKEFMQETRDAYKSVQTLINRRNAIKRAVTLSNAKTLVKIGNKEYTVAEAIDMKSTGLNPYRHIISKMAAQLELARRTVNKKNGEELDARADDYMRSLCGSTEMKNMSDELKKMRENFVNTQTMIVLDPLDAAKEIKRMEDTVDSFMTEVDSALSVSNALTTIDVEYETL